MMAVPISKEAFMRLIPLIVMLALAGCHSMPTDPQAGFIGKPIDAVAKKLGPPKSQRDFDDAIVYSWDYSYIKARYIFIHDREACVLDVTVRHGLVAAIDFRGDSGPCAELQDSLEN
jgi:hypothetical protein